MQVKKQLRELEVAPSAQMRDLVEPAFDRDTVDNLVLWHVWHGLLTFTLVNQ